MAQGIYCALLTMYTAHKTITKKTKTKIPEELLESYEGESIEDKCRRITNTGAPIESISPMIYTERKEGVRPETNIRTDKWDIAIQAMTTIADGKRKIREERDKPVSDSKVNDQKNK